MTRGTTDALRAAERLLATLAILESRVRHIPPQTSAYGEYDQGRFHHQLQCEIEQVRQHMLDIITQLHRGPT